MGNDDASPRSLTAAIGAREDDKGGAYAPVSQPPPSPGLGKWSLFLGASAAAMLLLAIAAVLWLPHAPAELQGALRKASVDVLIHPGGSGKEEGEEEEQKEGEVTARDEQVHDSDSEKEAQEKEHQRKEQRQEKDRRSTRSSSRSAGRQPSNGSSSIARNGSHSASSSANASGGTSTRGSANTSSSSEARSSTNARGSGPGPNASNASAGGGRSGRDSNATRPPADAARGGHPHAAHKPAKGGPFEMRLVDGFVPGCCSWSDKCDRDQAFCNKDRGSCETCDGHWRTEHGPAHFGGSRHAWCAKGCMDSWRVPAVPEYLPAATSPLQLKVLTYNLMWWRVYGKKHGMHGREGKLVRETGPYDLMGFQECEDPWRLLGDGGVGGEYAAMLGGKGKGSEAVCLAFRKAAWKELGRGSAYVAEDGEGKYVYYGKRLAAWFRLQHRKTGETVVFVVHHGPLPLSSGGRCGGHATGFHLLKLVAERSRKGDAVVLLGDFNADSDSLTVQTVASQLPRVYTGESFGGIDHVFTNLGHRRVAERRNLGMGGSDHDALSVTFQLGSRAKS